MKCWFSILFFVFAVLGVKAQNVQTCQSLDEAERTKVVYVGDARSFLDAIQSGATICIRPNTVINLSEVLNDDVYFRAKGRAWVEDMESYHGNANIISESVFNGRQLTLCHLSDITIVGDYNSHIVVDPPYAFVLNFVNCRNIKLENITMGHTQEGYCTGGVVGLKSCVKANISYCDLYGCGAYGLVSENCVNLGMYNTVIRDCSYGIMLIFNTQKVVFENCDFIRNREFTMVEIDSNSEDLLFSECRFAQNQGVLFGLGTQIRMENCLIQHPDEEQLGNLDTHLANEATGTKVVFTNMPLGRKQYVGVDSKNLGAQTITGVYDIDQSDQVSAESKGYSAMVTYFSDLAEAMKYVNDMGYPRPALYGAWLDGESTFVLLPAESSSVLELWHAEYGEDQSLVRVGEKPIMETVPGKPLCFSHMAMVGKAKYMVICRKSDGSCSCWAPAFNNNDGSMISDENFIDG